MTPRKEIKILKAKLAAQERALWEVTNFLERAALLGVHEFVGPRLDASIHTAEQNTGLSAADREAAVEHLKEVRRLLGLR